MSNAQALKGNLWKYGAFLITSRRVAWPILTVFFITFPDNTLRQIGYFMAAGQIAGVLFELPSGYIADKIGHKKALIIAKVSMLVSTSFYLFGGNVWIFAVGSMFHATSVAFHSGTLSAFMHETLTGLGQEQEYSRIIGRIKSISLLFSAGLLAVVPAFVAINIRAPFVIALVLDFVGLFIVLSFVVPKTSQVEIEEIKAGNFRKILAEGKSRNFFPVLIFSALVTGIVMSVGTYRDVYQQFLGIPIVYLGVLLALSRIVASFLSAIGHKLKNKLTITSYYFLQILYFVPLMFAVGYFQNRWIIVVLFIIIIGSLWGRGSLTEHYKLDYLQGSVFKATLLSLGGLIRYITFGLSSLVIGFLIGKYSYVSGYMIYAGIGLVLFVIAYIYFLKSRRKVEQISN